MEPAPGIGQINERPLHAALKQWCAQPGDRFEVPIDGFVIDVVRDGELIEIQTGGFTSLRSKLTHLLQGHRVRLVHPIAQQKWIVRLAEDGTTLTRRRSPRRGRVEDVFWQAVRLPRLLLHPNLTLELVLTHEEEARTYDGRRGWRRKGWVVEERRLLAVVEHRILGTPEDWLDLLPQGCDEFTTRELVDSLGIRLPLAQKMAYTLRAAGLVKLLGRRGRANLYRVSGARRRGPASPRGRGRRSGAPRS